MGIDRLKKGKASKLLFGLGKSSPCLFALDTSSASELKDADSDGDLLSPTSVDSPSRDFDDLDLSINNKRERSSSCTPSRYSDGESTAPLQPPSPRVFSLPSTFLSPIHVMSGGAAFNFMQDSKPSPCEFNSSSPRMTAPQSARIYGGTTFVDRPGQLPKLLHPIAIKTTC